MRWLVLALLLAVLAAGTAQGCSLAPSNLSELAAVGERFVFDYDAELRSVAVMGGAEERWGHRFFLRLESHPDAPAFVAVGQQGLDSMCEGRSVVDLHAVDGTRLGTWDGVAAAMTAQWFVYVPSEGSGLHRMALADGAEDTLAVPLPDERRGLRLAAHGAAGIALADSETQIWSWLDGEGQPIREGLPAPGERSLKLAFSPSGDHLAITGPAPYRVHEGGPDDTVVLHVWDLTAADTVWEWRLPGQSMWPPTDLVWHGEQLLLRAADRLWLVDPATGTAVERVGPEGMVPGGMAVSQFGVLVAWRTPDMAAGGVALVIDAQARQAIWLEPDGAREWAPREALNLQEGATVQAIPGDPVGPTQPDRRVIPGLLVAPMITLLTCLAILLRRRPPSALPF